MAQGAAPTCEVLCAALTCDVLGAALTCDVLGAAPTCTRSKDPPPPFILAVPVPKTPPPFFLMSQGTPQHCIFRVTPTHNHTIP